MMASITQTDAIGGETSYTYDLAGQRLTLTDPEDNTTTWAYDNLGRIETETNQLHSAPRSTFQRSTAQE